MTPINSLEYLIQNIDFKPQYCYRFDMHIVSAVFKIIFKENNSSILCWVYSN